MSTDQYGRYYWYVRLADDAEVHFHSDELTVTDSGALIGSTEKNGKSAIMFAVGSGQWKCAYAASVMDGGPVAVDHWHGAGSKKRSKKC